MEERELREMRQKVNETHQMVSRLLRMEKNRRFWRALKLVFIAVIIVGAYFAIAPVFKSVIDTYETFSSGVSDVQNFKFPWQVAPEQEAP